MKIGNWISQRLARLSPFKELLTRAGNAIREAREIQRSAKIDTLMEDEIRFQRLQLNQRMNEMLMIREAEVACYQPDKALALQESGRLGTPIEGVAQFKERMWELELALEDRGWVRETTLASLEFSRMGVGQLIRIARIYAIKNPIIKRGAEICRLYVFGRGYEIRSEDEDANDVIQGFLEANKAEMGHVGLAQKEISIQTDGALYFGLATDARGNVTVSNIDPLEIMDVLVDPDDSSRPLYFKRQWIRGEISLSEGRSVGTPQKAWYPSLQLVESQPTEKPDMMGDAPVNWDMPIYRVKVGSPPAWRWGIPPVYACIDWARAYKDFLEDWATVQRALARFALMVETKGGPGAIAAYNALLSTTFANSDGTQIERNPPPNVASAHIAGPDNKVTAFKSAGSQDSPEQARRLLLQCAASLGLPETFFGDASTGSLATALSLDRPTELLFSEIQRRWIDVIVAICRYVLAVSNTSPGGRMKEARKKNPAPQPVQEIKISVEFPSVVEHDITNRIQAICYCGTLGGRQGILAGIVDRKTLAELLLQEIGVEDRDQLLQDMGYGDDYDAEADLIDQRTQAAPQNVDQGGGPSGSPAAGKPATPPVSKESVRALVARLRKSGTALANGRP